MAAILSTRVVNQYSWPTSHPHVLPTDLAVPHHSAFGTGKVTRSDQERMVWQVLVTCLSETASIEWFEHRLSGLDDAGDSVYGK